LPEQVFVVALRRYARAAKRAAGSPSG
jgi:hypothetical protein